MTSLQIIDLAIKLSTLLGVIFAVYLYFRRPQEKSETADAVFYERMSNYEKTTEKSIQLALNHSHTVESKLDQHIRDNTIFALESTKSLSKIESLLEQHLKQ
jgi:hypothetical protein